MHMFGGMLAILFLVWQFPKCIEAFEEEWQSGVGFISSLADWRLCVWLPTLGLGLNLLKVLFEKKEP